MSQQIARGFTGARLDRVAEIFDSLASLGQVREDESPLECQRVGG